MLQRTKNFFRVIGFKLKILLKKLKLWYKESTRTKVEMIAELIERREEVIKRAIKVANGDESVADWRSMADLMEWVITPHLYRTWKAFKAIVTKKARMTEMTTYKMIEDIEKISKEVNEDEQEKFDEEV